MTSSPAIPSPYFPPAMPPDARIMLAIRGAGFGAESEPTPAADAAAWTLVGLLVFCVVWIVAAALLMKRRLRKQSPLTDPTPKARTHSKSMGDSPTWQKSEDWWKQ